jgi:hypothetical protein
MRYIHLGISLLVAVLVTLPANADTLAMRDGKKIIGTFLGAAAGQIEFLTAAGKSVKLPVETVGSLTFDETLKVAGLPRASKTPAKPPVVLPAGTAFRVRTIDFIDVDSTQAGARFRGAIDDPIMSGGEVIVPRGAEVKLVAAKVQQGGKMKGSDLIALKVNFIVVHGRSYSVATSLSETKSAGEGKKTAGKIVGGAGLGALIGGIAGGGKGAGIGALVGGGGGTILAATGEPHLKIPSETQLEFQLAADWKIH